MTDLDYSTLDPGIRRTCGMIVGHGCDNEGNLTDDIECGRTATMRHRSDHKHTICSECHAWMMDDPDIQAEYELLPPGVGEP